MSAATDQSPSPTRLVVLPRPPLLDGTSSLSTRHSRPSAAEDLLRATASRLAAFLAEAAVLVLVLGILDRFLASSRWEPRWVASAFAISLVLLAGSVVLDVAGRRWLSRDGGATATH